MNGYDLNGPSQLVLNELLQHCPECRQLCLGPEQELLQGPVITNITKLVKGHLILLIFVEYS